MKEQSKVYLVRAGKMGEDEELSIDNNLAIIGFRDVPSLEGTKDYDAVFKVVREALPEEKTRAIGNFAGQLWAFSLAMKEGDLVVLPRKLTSQIAIGQVSGPYRYQKIGDENRHTRPVKWLRVDIPRTTFQQDLLYSFGAFMTVCNISRNDAERRVATVMEGRSDPGPSTALEKKKLPKEQPLEPEPHTLPDLLQLAHDQIIAHIESRFAGHALANLVNAVLQADGWITRVSPPGADGGVDILAGRGTLGLDSPRLGVQVKSQKSPCDVTIYRALQGTMQTFKAEQGLLMCWGGFNKAVLVESKQSHFSVRLWDSSNLVEAIYRNYERLPAEIQAELPLKRVWMLVREEEEQ
ncbi:MAG: restriction endonuclease [Syntrophaceae bacterium]|nr:restriction endonuclease [Syntrophaceae bacterium]